MVYSWLPKALDIQNLLIFTEADALPCCGRKLSSRTSLSCRSSFWAFGMITFILNHFETRILLNPVLGCLTSVCPLSEHVLITQTFFQSQICFESMLFSQFKSHPGKNEQVWMHMTFSHRKCRTDFCSFDLQFI